MAELVQRPQRTARPRPPSTPTRSSGTAQRLPHDLDSLPGNSGAREVDRHSSRSQRQWETIRSGPRACLPHTHTHTHSLTGAMDRGPRAPTLHKRPSVPSSAVCPIAEDSTAAVPKTLRHHGRSRAKDVLMMSQWATRARAPTAPQRTADQGSRMWPQIIPPAPLVHSPPARDGPPLPPGERLPSDGCPWGGGGTALSPYASTGLHRNLMEATTSNCNTRFFGVDKVTVPPQTPGGWTNGGTGQGEGGDQNDGTRTGSGVCGQTDGECTSAASGSRSL